MKLGIAVVYMVLPGDAKLIDLHLRYIERCTQVPFTIYAAANRLSPDLRDHLAAKPYVRVCSIPTTDRRGSLENAYYLERLIATAIGDDVTHVATFHVDSFPIRTGWATDLEQAISRDYAFAAVVREDLLDRKPMTACLFFPRGFYIRHRPKLLLSREAMRSGTGRQYASGIANPMESGTGYGYVAFREGLQWHPLERTNAKEDHHYFGSIHGDLVFHLGSSAAKLRSFSGARDYRRFRYIRQKAAGLLPRRVKTLLRCLIPQRILFPESPSQQRVHSEIKEALLADPETYLARLGMAGLEARSRGPRDPATQ